MSQAKHLSEENLALFLQQPGDHTEQERLFALDHLADCENCAGRFADHLQSSAAMQHAPGGFASEVMRKIHRYRREFALYSLRVTAATCATLLLLLWGTTQLVPAVQQAPRVREPGSSIVAQWGKQLSQFSELLISGGQVYEKETE